MQHATVSCEGLRRQIHLHDVNHLFLYAMLFQCEPAIVQLCTPFMFYTLTLAQYFLLKKKKILRLRWHAHAVTLTLARLRWHTHAVTLTLARIPPMPLQLC